MRRAEAYRDAGADGLFVPGLTDDDEISRLVRRVELPLNVLAGRPVPELARLGVARVSTGSMLFRAALHATAVAARSIAQGDPGAGDLPSYAEAASLVHTAAASLVHSAATASPT